MQLPSTHRRHQQNPLLLCAQHTRPPAISQSVSHAVIVRNFRHPAVRVGARMSEPEKGVCWSPPTPRQFACRNHHFGVEVVCRGGTGRAGVRQTPVCAVHAAEAWTPARTYVLTAFAHVPPLLVPFRLDYRHLVATHPAELALQLGPDHLLLGEFSACADTLLPA